MDAKKSMLHSFLSQQLILNVPIYQRKYNWSFDECKQLFNDILNIGNNDDLKKSYFIGSIVYKKEESTLSAGTPQEFVLIDGQQRTTTITLIYCALCDYYKGVEANLCNHYLINFLLNNDLKKSNKLNLTTEDDVTLKRIIKSITNDKKLERKDDDSLNLYANYELFKKLIKDENINILRKGLERLLFIEIGLDNDDNPQLIFESLNSTGLELKKNDLIRNFILMGLDSQHQNDLYEDYWHEIELGFKNEDDLFDEFIRYYLAVKKGKLPKKYNIYKDFKIHAQKFDCVDNLVKDIYKFANYFFNIHFEKEKDEELLKAFKSLNDLEFNVTLPFLLSVYDDYNNAENNSEINLTKEEFVEIVKYVESYCLRRSICDIPTNSMNNTFAGLANEIDKTDYFNYFVAVMAEKSTYKRFPTDLEVKENILIKNMFSKKRTLNHILEKIENSHTKQVVDISKCSIEHIMPQSLSDCWKIELGDSYEEIHEKYLHTLGNLTLTPYNPDMGNKCFNDKKTMPEKGFIDSKFYLNKVIAKLDSWNENEIINRSERLSNEIIKIWKHPTETEEIAEIIEIIDETEDTQDYSLDDFQELEERSLPKKLIDSLSLMILNMDSSIKENVRKSYVAFNNKNKNFVEISLNKKGLQIILDIPINELDDKKQLCEDVSDIQVLGTGDTRVYLMDDKDVNYIMSLIKQSYDYNLEQGFELKRVQDIIDDEKCKDISCAVRKLEKLYDHPDVIKTVEMEAGKIDGGALENKALQGSTKELGVATSLYMSCRIAHAPFSKEEISTIYGVKSKLIMKLSKKLSKILDIELPFSYPKDYLSRYCEILELSHDVEDKASEMCDEIENKGLRMGKSPTTIAASVLYLTSVKMDEKRTQGDISEMVGISEVVIRNYCRLLREELDSLS